ncbi:MAG: PQQ-binding-like beta-propeller repeat protein [Melioribacteraceae bacterium]|nr:PQQ-binding-like beta-propeller repeat protein [Melioribacteraceae bacterium]
MKNQKKIFSFFITLIFSLSVYGQEAPTWMIDLGEPIKDYNFINNDKYLFFNSEEYAWCYNVENGEKVWDMEIDGFAEEGISYLLGEMYLTNSDNKLQAYDALTGNLLWENEYDGIDQDDYSSFEFIENNAVFRYGEDHIGIDLNNGNELYRMEIEYWGELVDLGTFNYSVLYDQEKMLVMEDDELAVLYDINTGERLYKGEDYDINRELIASSNPWLYKSPEHKYVLLVLEDGAAVIDVANNKELIRKEFSIDGEINVLLPTAIGCAVMGDEKIVHFNFNTGSVVELEFPVDDIRTFYSYEISGKNILVVSLEDVIAGIDLVAGTILWQTAEDDETYEGYIHKYVMQDGNNIIFVQNRALMMAEENGTYLFLMSMDGLTGKLNYKTAVLGSRVALMDFQRTLAKVITGAFSTFVTVGSGGVGAGQASQAMDMVNNMLGYQNIGFEYDVFVEQTIHQMFNPKTREDGGEGIVKVDPKTGKIEYAAYMDIAAGMNEKEFNSLAQPYFTDDKLVLAGNERLVLFDITSGEKKWEIGENVGFVSDLALIDGALYAKFGKQEYGVGLKENEVEVKMNFDEDPFGFHAIDPETGSIIWTIKTESDPGLVTPEFSIANYYDESNHRLYFADEMNIYALKLGREGGSYDWKFNFDDNGTGEMEYDETFAVTEKWIGSKIRSHSTSTYIGGGWVMTTTTKSGGLDVEETSTFLEDAAGSELSTTYESWGNIWGVTAKRCLRVLYGGELILVFGPDGIALVNSSDGKSKWQKEWDYDETAVQYVPKIIGDKILYCMDEELVLLNLTDGSEIWRTDESEDSRFFLSPNNSFFFTINDEEISGYKLTP